MLLPSQAAWAWGGRMHEIINRRAAAMLTGPAGEAWGPLAPSLGMHASDADHRNSYVAEEPPRHYIDIDAWGSYPFDEVPRSFEKLVRKHGREKAAQFGVVPWAIEECYRMVVLSLRRGDWASAGAWGADLGHYVADSHQPLHCTLNYNGQNTGNDGIHIRYEVKMMNRFYDERKIIVPERLPDPGGDVVEFCFGWIAQAYSGMNAILHGDDVARGADSDFGDRYYEVLWQETAAVSELQMERAVHDLAAVYAAAWEEAGRPGPPAEVPPFRALTVEQLVPPENGGHRASRGALILAASAILGAFALGSL